MATVEPQHLQQSLGTEPNDVVVVAAAIATATSQPKQIIGKQKLTDFEFDKLVIDTSCRLAKQADASSNDWAVLRSLDADAASSANQDQVVKVENGAAIQHPKRPMNAFMVWGQVIRRELHHRFSNVQNASLSKALGRVWRSLDAEQKEPYVRRANIIKVNHKRDYPNYRYQPRRILERRARANLLLGINNNQQQQSLVNGCSIARNQETANKRHSQVDTLTEDESTVVVARQLQVHDHSSSSSSTLPPQTPSICPITAYQHQHHLMLDQHNNNNNNNTNNQSAADHHHGEQALYIAQIHSSTNPPVCNPVGDYANWIRPVGGAPLQQTAASNSCHQVYYEQQYLEANPATIGRHQHQHQHQQHHHNGLSSHHDHQINWLETQQAMRHNTQQYQEVYDNQYSNYEP